MVRTGLVQPMIFSHSFSAMDSDCEVRLVCKNHGDAERGFALVVDEVERIEAKYSIDRKQSPWQQMVQDAGSGQPVKVDEETSRLLDMAEMGYTLSEGLFDVTLTPLVEIWDWNKAAMPGSAAIAEAKSRSGWGLVDWQRPNLLLPDLGMKMDLRGLCKEYSADACIELLQQEGFGFALVDLGGDVAACQDDESKPAWQVEIRQSRSAELPAAKIELRNGGLATRGDYDLCMVVNGIRYSHMLDPRNGWPVQGLASVSVLAPQCVTAGVLATTAMVRGPHQGPPWLQRMDVEYMCTDSAGKRSGPLDRPSGRASNVA
jgi:thiamine biosynthesis lipoprotein